MDDQKVKSSLYAFIMNHKLLLYLYFFSLDDGLIADLKKQVSLQLFAKSWGRLRFSLKSQWVFETESETEGGCNTRV